MASDLEERDGPFDLTPSEIVAIMNHIGVYVSREQAAAFPKPNPTSIRV